MLVRSLCLHNTGFDFEIVISHDDRAEDGSREAFRRLSEEFSNVVVVESTNDDAIHYIENVLDHYDRRSIFTDEIRAGLRSNFQKYKSGELFPRNGSILWLTPGRLYNKAVEASKGDIIVVTAGDFMYMMPLRELEGYVARSQSRDGHYYGKPNAVWAKVSNQELSWLSNHVREHTGGDSVELFRDYTRIPHRLEDLYVADLARGELISFVEQDSLSRLRKHALEMISGGRQHIRAFHGFHVMTRKTYDVIGGFTEEFYGRALAEDKMSMLGSKISGNVYMPPDFSVAWCGQYEIVPTMGQGYKPGWELEVSKIDPFWGKHPIPGRDSPTYLHNGILDESGMIKVVTANFDQWSPPLRFQ
jgi:hypothetical protein